MAWVEYYGEAKEVMRKAYGKLTKEETVRNFFGLNRTEQVDGNGKVIDINDDMRSDARCRATGVYDYYQYAERLASLWVSENDMINFFPHVTFIKIGSWATDDAWVTPSIPDIQEATTTAKKWRRKSSVEQQG